MNPIWARDSLTVRLNVREDDDTAFDLTGATVAAVARPVTGTALAAQVTIADAVAGEVDLRWAAGSFSQGVWSLQAWVTKAGETQTVLETQLTVRASLALP